MECIYDKAQKSHSETAFRFLLLMVNIFSGLK